LIAHRSRSALALAASLLLPLAAWSAPMAPPPAKSVPAKAPSRQVETERYGVYFAGARIGSLVTKSFPVTYDKRPATRVDADTQVKMTALGQALEQRVVLSQVMDNEGRPCTTRVTITSGGRDTTIDARYEPTRVVCNVNAGGQQTQKVLPIPKGITLTADPEQGGLDSKTLKVGQKSVLHFFEPMSITIQRIETEVLRSEPRTVRGEKTTAFLVRSTNAITGQTQSWVDARGRMLEENSPTGLRLVREDLGAAPPTLAYQPPTDFAVATSVKTKVPIQNARQLATLRLKITGVPDETLVLSDARQKVEKQEAADGKFAVTYQIRARELPARALPAVAAGTTGPGLGDAPYLGTDAAEIQAEAKSLKGEETDRALIARRVRAWVKGHMQKPSNIGTPRSAVEILRTRDGVCRDYATLFAAVARAAGVPTRICSGIVYFENAFFYHAWVECQLTEGEDGWYAFDPTLGDDFVDATHVKFAQGDPVAMYGAVRVVGQIQAEVLPADTAATR
jgi:transglutaminase-like putative cysteine protease